MSRKAKQSGSANALVATTVVSPSDASAADVVKRIADLRIETLELVEAGESIDDIYRRFRERGEPVSYEQVAGWTSRYVDSIALHAYENGVMECVERIIAGSGGRISLGDIHKAITSDRHAFVFSTNAHVNGWVYAIEESKGIVNEGLVAMTQDTANSD
jgi:hypothetical protein